MGTIVANYDGPLYLVVSKTFYQPELIKNFSFNLPVEYYAAHFPMYPSLVNLFAFLFGFPYSMLFVTVISSCIALFFFSRLIEEYVDKKDILWITLVFALLPARWLIVRSVGSPEPLFVAAIVASIYYFKKEKFIAAAVWGAVATITKSPGVLLFAVYIFAYFLPHIKKIGLVKSQLSIKDLSIIKFLPILVIPLSLVGVFALFQFRLHDFFAYFHSGDNIHLFFPPFQIFNYSQPWVGTFWLEEVIFVYLFGVLGLLELIKRKESVLAWFVGIFFASTLFVSHRDIIRYSLPIVPFLFIAFKDVLVKREFKIAMAVLIIPILLFSLVYISQNVMPISDWSPLL